MEHDSSPDQQGISCRTVAVVTLANKQLTVSLECAGCGQLLVVSTIDLAAIDTIGPLLQMLAGFRKDQLQRRGWIPGTWFCIPCDATFNETVDSNSNGGNHGN